MQLVPAKGRKMFYASDIDGRYGFPQLALEAEAVGADISKGDIAIFDNPNQKRRKVLVRSPKRGIMLVTVLLNNKNDGSFNPLASKDGLVKGGSRNYLN